MKIRLVSSYDGLSFNFVVENETREEVEILRHFVVHSGKDTRLFLHSFGGDIERTRESFCFGWRYEKDFKPKNFMAKLKYPFG